MKSKLKIRERKLHAHRAVGLYWHGENLIEIDPRLKAKKYLNTLLHECLHHCLPAASEAKVSRIAGTLTESVWKKGYRRLAE